MLEYTPRQWLPSVHVVDPIDEARRRDAARDQVVLDLLALLLSSCFHLDLRLRSLLRPALRLLLAPLRHLDAPRLRLRLTPLSVLDAPRFGLLPYLAALAESGNGPGAVRAQGEPSAFQLFHRWWRATAYGEHIGNAASTTFNGPDGNRLLGQTDVGSEYVRVGFTDAPAPAAPPGLRLFIDHSRCGRNATDPRTSTGASRHNANANAQVQIAPLPPAALRRTTDSRTGATRVGAIGGWYTGPARL